MSGGVLVGMVILFGICWWCSRQMPKDPELMYVSLNPFKGGEWDWQGILYWVVIIGLALIGLYLIATGGPGDEWEWPYRY